MSLTGAGSIASSSGLTDNGAFDISSTTSGAMLAGLSGNGTVALGSQTLALISGTFSGIIGGSGGNLVIAGSTTLSGANSYTGTTNINAGTLALSGAGSIGSSGSLTNLGIFDISQTTAGTSLKSLSGSGSVALGSKSLTLTSATGNYTGTFQDGGIGGGTGGSLAITGGTQILSGASAYTGTTEIGSGATLQIGNNGPTGALGSGAVTDNGTLAYFLSSARTVSNVISGAGGLTQGGAGILTVTAAEAYTGVTVINSSRTLALSGVGSLASSAVADAGVFDISGVTTGAAVASLSGAGVVALGSKTLTVANGSGSFTGTINDGGIAGGTGGGIAVSSGTEILSGANTYTGATEIASDAIIQVGTGGSTGTLGGGPVTDNGTLVYDRRNSVALSTAVSGTGGVTQAGTGTLIITGTEVYTGPTTASSGTLQIGTGGTAGSVAGNILDNAVLVFNRSDAVTYAGIISGDGTFTQAGSGNLILTGTSSFTGATNVSAGTLSVNGSLASSAIAVASGGKLGGSGTVGPVTLAAGGMLSPGNSIGTLTVDGAVILATGSTYTVELSPTASDKLVVNGAATLAGSLVLVPATGTYIAGTDYVLVSANSVSGTFGTVTGAVSGFTNTIQYRAQAVDLILSAPAAPGTPPATQPVTPATNVITIFLFGTYGKTPNQIAAGNALTAGSFSGTLYVATGNVVKTNTAAVPATLGQLAGDIHASIRSAAIEDSRIIRDTVLNRLDRISAGMGVWTSLFGGYGSISSDGNATALHHDSSGVMAGLDTEALENLRLGAAVAYSTADASTPGKLSTAKGKVTTILGYGGYGDGKLDLRAGVAYSFGNVRIVRAISAPSYVDSDRQYQHTSQAFVTGGWKFVSDNALVEPYVGIAIIEASSSAFAENGDAGALSGAGKSDTQAYATLGLKAALNGVTLNNDMTITPKIDLGWQHAFAGFRPGQVVTFQNAAQSFTVLGVPLTTDAAVLQLGFDLALAPDLILNASYDGSFSGSVQDNALRLGLDLGL